MEPVTDALLTPPHSDGGAVKQALVACDSCHARKVRCDRDAPCRNCQDSGTECRRQRGKLGRPFKTIVAKEQAAEIPELQKRLSSVEESVKTLFALFDQEILEKQKADTQPRKRRASKISNDVVVQQCSTLNLIPDSIDPADSTSRAQKLIQHELTRVPTTFREKRTALQSALSFLKNNLNTMITDGSTTAKKVSKQSLVDLPVPDLSLIQWMLQSEDPGRSVCSKNDFMPFLSRRTVTSMALSVMQIPRDQCDPASIACVAAYAGYFLQEIVLSKTDKITGFESCLQKQAEELFDTARKWTDYLAYDAPASLASLQALTFGVMLAQEAGDFFAAWKMAKTAGNICLTMKLHKSGNLFANTDAEVEAYYCFALCYMNDKGLAMNLGQPAFLPDSEIEINILTYPTHAVPIVDNFYLYLNLATIQGSMIRDLEGAKDSIDRKKNIDSISSRMDDVWRLKAQKEIPRHPKDSYSTEMEIAMVELAFFSVRTLIYQSGAETSRDPKYAQASIEAARAALFRVQRARIVSRLAQYDNRYMKSSFAHWTILYYPFTPFFVLFCNVVRTNNMRDFAAMQEFVAYLSEVKGISKPLFRLYKLCSVFVSLINTVANVNEEKPHNMQEAHRAQRHMQLNASQPNTPDSLPCPEYPHHMVAQAVATQNQDFEPSSQIGSAPWPSGFANDEVYLQNMPQYIPDPLYEEFLGYRPTLQWLDSDFDHMWEEAGCKNLFTPT